MPRYHFNVFDGTAVHDDRGLDLPDREAAWTEATNATSELLKGFGSSLRSGKSFRMEVTDEFQNPLWQIKVQAFRK